MASNRIELWGRLVNQPELRTTPGGMPLLRLAMECGADGEQLRLEVAMTGERAREAASQLKAGQELYVSGRLRAVRRAGRPALRMQPIEVLASEIRSAAG